MPTFNYTPAINPQTGVPMPGVQVDFVLSVGGAAQPITDLNGTAIPKLIANATTAVLPQFKHATATRGFLTDGTVYLSVISDETQDGAAAAQGYASQAQQSASTAQQAAADAAGAVGNLSSTVNSINGRLVTVENTLANGGGGSSGGGAPAIAAGMKLNTTINAADTGNAWPSPIRLSGDPIYAVTFLGPIAPPPAVAVGSPDGMQPGDTYYYTGS